MNCDDDAPACTCPPGVVPTDVGHEWYCPLPAWRRTHDDAAPAQRCRGNNPTCPCQDGDLCHYVDDPVTDTKAMEPAPAQRAYDEGYRRGWLDRARVCTCFASKDEVDRQRMHDAEVAAKALQPFEDLFSGGPDTPCRTTWRGGVDLLSGYRQHEECVEVPLDDLREAFARAVAVATQEVRGSSSGKP